MFRSTVPQVHAGAPLLRLGGALRLARAWLRARRERRQLVALSDAMLRDIGLTRADVEREYLKPFWEQVDHAALDADRRRMRC